MYRWPFDSGTHCHACYADVRVERACRQDWHTFASVPNEVKFAGLMASLRAPRVAVIVPTNGWELHAQRAIESFSRTWGGRPV
jgi:hypothetical protein